MGIRRSDVEIRRPCPVRLDASRAAGGVKSWYCGHCEKSVHVLSNMSEPEARAFLAQRVGQDLCVTYAVKADGSVRFRAPTSTPAPAPAVSLVPNLVPIGALTRGRKIAAAVGLGAALAACAPHDNPSVEVKVHVTERRVESYRETPTIPDAREPRPPEHQVVGRLARPLPPPPPSEPEPPEDLLDGEIEAVPLPPPEPTPPAGGITVRPLPPANDVD